MSNAWLDQQARKSEWPIRLVIGRDAEPGQRIIVEAGLHRIGDQAPYFSVTGELRDKSKPKNSDRGLITCGAIHEGIARWFPELAPVIALHLSDHHGVPMHAVENARYWAGRTQYADQANVDTLQQHLRCRPEEARELMAGSGLDDDGFREAIESMVPRWQTEAEAGVALLIELGATS
jgi:hypothetical protein